jgi:hypothetical protein
MEDSEIDYSCNESPQQITSAISGKTIDKVTDGDGIVTFHFTDGTKLKVRYDWLYYWSVE